MKQQRCRCDGHGHSVGDFVPESQEEYHGRVLDFFESKPRGASPNPPTGAPAIPKIIQHDAAGGLSPDKTAPAVPPAKFQALLGSVLAIMVKSEAGRAPLDDDNRYTRCRSATQAVFDFVLEEMVTPFAERFGLEESEVSELADTVIREWFKKSTPEAVKWMDLSPEASSRAREHCGIEAPCSKCHGAGLFGCGPSGCDRCKGTGKEPKDEGQEAVK